MFSSLSSPAVFQTTSSAHISTCLHNLFWWRMRTRYAATWINGIRLPRINRYNYRCSRNELYLQLAHGASLQSLHTDRTCPLPDRFARTSGKFGSPFLFPPPHACIPQPNIHHDFPVSNYRWLTKQLQI